MARARDERGGERWFFLEAGAGRGPRLGEEDERHALKVLRLEPGAVVVALDGEGSARRLELVAVERSGARWRELELAAEEPEPGAPGAALPWIELAVAPPKGSRADEMVERLVQLGVSGITVLAPERTQGFARDAVPERLERWERLAREQLKQCHRLWLPRFAGPVAPEAHLAAHPAALDLLLDPRAERRLGQVVADAPRGTRERPLRLWIGPEGGWTPAELAALSAAGAIPVGLAPSVLRIETAAEAAAAIVVHASWS
ncbi:MAG: RsmE family RNA methyltransferase [Planctomycetota bacterium]|nr:RsmE family RNA methyltransferase [Planctomycetota bacterium]